jgi:prepilin-type N-terminal cleavage/methylation domain-containing protein
MSLVRQTPTKGSVMSDTLNRLQINRRHRGLQGFTLIEMLIVIVVLGVLAAIVVFALGGVTGQSATAACTSDARTVSTAVSAYEASPPSGVAVGTAPSSLSTLVPGYLKSLPANSNLYAISLSADDAVQVTLGSDAPGAAYADASGAQLYEQDGNTQPFSFASADGSLAGQGICAGA